MTTLSRLALSTSFLILSFCLWWCTPKEQTTTAINTYNNYVTGLLHQAANRNDVSALEELLTYYEGNNVTNIINAKDEAGNTPLQIAAKTKSLAAFSTLIEHGALDLPVTSHAHINDASQNVLHTAVSYSNVTFVAAILETPVGKTMLESQDALNKSTPLHYAVANSHFEIVELLLLNGANVEARNAFGQTPLIVAVRLNNTKMFRLLVDHGAWIYAADNVPFSVIHHAVIYGATEITRLLIERYGVDKDYTAPNRQLYYSPLMVVAGSFLPESLDTLKMLVVDYKANIQFSTKYGERTPVGAAALNSRLSKLEFLLRHGGDANFCGGCTDNKTPLNLATGYSDATEEWRTDEQACGWEMPQTVSLLLRYGADVNQGSPLCNLLWLKRKMRPSIDRCQPGNIAVAMRLLIENGAKKDSLACGNKLSDCTNKSFLQCLEKDVKLKEAFDTISSSISMNWVQGRNATTLVLPVCKTICKYPKSSNFSSVQYDDGDAADQMKLLCKEYTNASNNIKGVAINPKNSATATAALTTTTPDAKPVILGVENLLSKLLHISSELQRLRAELQELISSQRYKK